MKKILTVITILFVICLTGCSKSDPTAGVTVGWKDGVISFGNKDSDLTSYEGYKAEIKDGQLGLTYSFSLDTAKDVTNLSVNTQQILEENMEKYKGCYYYTEYLGTELTVAKSLGNDFWIVCETFINGQTPEAVVSYIVKQFDILEMTESAVKCDFGDFTFGNEFDSIIVRTDSALITGVIKVSKGSKGCTETFSITQNNKEYQLKKLSGTKYDYYEYNGYLIQCLAGYDITEYITFK